MHPRSERPKLTELPADQVQTYILDSAEMVQRFWSNMAMLDDCSYDDDELGSCLVAALQYPDRHQTEFDMCAEHFARGLSLADQAVVQTAIHELLGGLQRLFERLPIRDETGKCLFTYKCWVDGDALAIERIRD